MKALLRVLRGCSWFNSLQYNLRASVRNGIETDFRLKSFGFRLVVRVKGEGMVDVPKS